MMTKRKRAQNPTPATTPDVPVGGDGRGNKVDDEGRTLDRHGQPMVVPSALIEYAEVAAQRCKCGHGRDEHAGAFDQPGGRCYGVDCTCQTFTER